MRFFPLLDFQHWILATCLGLGAVLLAYITWASYRTRKIEKLDDPYDITRKDIPGSDELPVFPLLFIVYLGIILWVIAYWILIGFYGGPII